MAIAPSRNELAPSVLATLAADLVWAFGLRDANGAELDLTVGPDATAAELRARVEDALERVRPVATAPSIAGAIGALRTRGRDAPPRARRRLLAELDALVAQAIHRRAKRQERRRILAELIVLFGLEDTLGTPPEPDVHAAVAAIGRAIAALLRP